MMYVVTARIRPGHSRGTAYLMSFVIDPQKRTKFRWTGDRRRALELEEHDAAAIIILIKDETEDVLVVQAEPVP